MMLPDDVPAVALTSEPLGPPRERWHPAFVLLCLLGGCSNLPIEPVGSEVGVDGIPCVGTVAPLPRGLAESTHSMLAESVRMPSGKGGVCSAKVVSVTQPVVLYRVFDGSMPHTKFGAWWALKPPGGTRSDYRQAYAICPEWSRLDRVVSCEVRPGSQLVLGTTQSAACADGMVYAKTAEIQAYVPNDAAVGIVHVGHCSEELAWPPPGR